MMLKNIIFVGMFVFVSTIFSACSGASDGSSSSSSSGGSSNTDSLSSSDRSGGSTSPDRSGSLSGSGSPSEQAGFTVMFDTNISDSSVVAPSSITVLGGSTITRPESPSRFNYDLIGWCKDSACQSEWNFTTDTLNQDIKLYANWDTWDNVDFPDIATNAPTVFDIGNLDDWKSAVGAMKEGKNGNNYIINVKGDVAGIDGTIGTGTFGTVKNTKISIRGTGSLSLLGGASTGALIYIWTDQTVVLRETSLIGRPDNVSYALVQLTTPGLSLGGNTKKPSVFIMKSGVIRDNISTGNGGGVGGGGTFIMAGGTISGNSAPLGGGVSYNNFTMNGGTISGNTAHDHNGGGVHGGDPSDFTMTGGTISGNTAIGGKGGGGVYIQGALSRSNFTMSGGTIRDNIASGTGLRSGGGVLYSSSSEGAFIMSGGSISHNTAGIGGGISTSENFTMNGGTISDNTADSMMSFYGAGYGGGGVWGDFTMNGGVIRGNTAFFGGGVWGDLTMNGGTISGNTAHRGGGVLFWKNFIKNGGVIHGKNADAGLKNTATDGDTKGHAVHCAIELLPKYRDTTAESGVKLDSNASDGWGQ